MWGRLVSALANRESVVAGTRLEALDHLPQHAYAVVKARELPADRSDEDLEEDAETPASQRMVTVFETSEGKETEIPFDDFMRDFGALTTLQ